jgi:septal ring factor EnvC (AmiA/AmiB activator)
LLKESDADRAAVREPIERINRQLKESEPDRAARFTQIKTLNKLLKESDADRAARLDQLRALGQLFKESEEPTMPLDQIKAAGRHFRIGTLRLLRDILPASVLGFLQALRHGFRRKTDKV